MPTKNNKRTYIGGTTSEARKKYFNYDKKLSQILSNLAASYNISPALVFDRLAHEGLIDQAIRDNNNIVLGKYSENQVASSAVDEKSYNNPYGMLGLDTIYDTYTKNVTKTKRPINFKKINRVNEAGELVNSGQTNNTYDALELFVAELASRRNQVKKDYPNLNDIELDSATAAKYNATDKYFKQLMDSGEYKTKYPIDVKGINIPLPSKTDSKYIKDQTQNIDLDDAFNSMTKKEYIYNNKTWNPDIFLESDGYTVTSPNNKIVQNILNRYAKNNFTHPDKVNFVREYKCGGRRKAQLGLDIREGGIAIPIANNMFYIKGRKHSAGGVAIGPNNKNGLEVEGGEVVKVGDNDIKVFSSVPLLRGVSPAQLVMGGANPNKVFKAQEDFKDRNHINDDGTHYQNGGNKVIKYENLPSSFKGKRVNGRILQGGVPPVLSRGELAMGNPIQRMGMWSDDLGEFSKYMARRIHKFIPKKVDTAYRYVVDYLSNKGPNNAIDNNAENLTKAISLFNAHEYKTGGIYIKPSKRGTFTTAAKKRGMDVQEFASKVLANKEDYSSAMVKKANFARNASRWKKEYGGDSDYYSIMEKVAKDNYKQWGFNNTDEALMHALNDNTYDYRGYYNKYPNSLANADTHWTDEFKTVYHPTFSIESKYSGNKSIYNPLGLKGGYWDGNNFIPAKWQKNKKEYGGNMIYTVNGNVKNGLMSARPKAQLGKTVKINRGSYETVEETVERYKQLYRIRYGKEPSKSDIDRVAWMKSLENAVNGDPNLITGYGPNVGVRGPNVTKIVSNVNKGKQIARSQSAVRNRNIKPATPQKQAVNTKISEAARAERQHQFDARQQGEAFNASTMPTDAVAVNRPTIGTGVRSGRKGRVDDVVAIERSQRGVDPLASKPEGSMYDKQYAKRYQNKTSQTANILAGAGAAGASGGYILSGGNFNDEENSLNNENKQNIKPVNNTSNNSSTSSNKKSNYTINGTFDNARPQYYAEKRLPIAGSQSIAEKAGLARSGWSYADNEPINLNYMPNINLSIPANYGKSSTPRKERSKATSSKAAAKPTPTLQDTVNQITRDAIYKSNTPKIDLSKVKMPTFDVGQLGSKETKAAKAKLNTSPTGGGKQSRWIGQYKPVTTADWIGLGSNLAGTVASYFMTKNAINKMPDPIKPVMAQAAKLKTRYNVEPQLTNIREAEQMNRAAVRHNTQSSNVSLAREQRLMNEARGARNVLYGQKENIETQLINQDRLNRQSVMRDNVRAYNEYLNRLTATRQGQNQLRISNINNLLSGLTGSVNNILGTIESRRATNNTLRAIAAANPNVDARLIGGFDYYIDPITKRKYNKNQQYVGTING